MKKVLIGLLLVLLVVACKPEAASQTPADTSTSPSNGDSQGSSSGSSGSTSTSTSTSTTNSAQSAFSSLMAARPNLEFQVDYAMKAVAGGQTIDTKMTQYIKGMTKMRMDVTVQGYESRTFVLDGTFTSCVNSGSWSCTTLTQSNDGIAKFQNDYAANPNEYVVVADGSMSVAGKTASCYKITKEEFAIRYCVSSEGVPLYMKSVSGAVSSELTATRYSLSVPSSAFDLPASSTSAGAAGGTTIAGSDECDQRCAAVPASYRAQCLASC